MQRHFLVVATDGKEAIKHLRDDQSFKILFTDVVLPGGMNGMDIAVEATRLQPDIKVLFTTGYAVETIVYDATLNPSTTVLSKPYLPAMLLEKVRELLGG